MTQLLLVTSSFGTYKNAVSRGLSTAEAYLNNIDGFRMGTNNAI